MPAHTSTLFPSRWTRAPVIGATTIITSAIGAVRSPA
jgi:hypothetical protein